MSTLPRLSSNFHSVRVQQIGYKLKTKPRAEKAKTVERGASQILIHPSSQKCEFSFREIGLTCYVFTKPIRPRDKVEPVVRLRKVKTTNVRIYLSGLASSYNILHNCSVTC